MTPEDHVAFTQTAFLAHMRKHRGIKDPIDRETKEPKNWMFVLFENKAIDVRRKHIDRRHLDHLAPFHEAGDGQEPERGFWTHDPGLDPDQECFSSPEGAAAHRDKWDAELAKLHRNALAEEEQARQFPLDLLRLEKLGLPGQRTLVWVIEYLPSELTHQHVARAGRRLARSAEDTWRLLGAWRRRHGDRTRTTASRREIAWILLSDDATDPDTWRSENTRACKLALDNVRRWRNLASTALANHRATGGGAR